MSISIYNPYFYIIQHTSSGRYYAGVKYAKDANYENFLKTNGYQTSSKIVKQIIFEEGLDAFAIRKIKVFETGEAALTYESRFLIKVNVAFNDSFLNRCNNSIGWTDLHRELATIARSKITAEEWSTIQKGRKIDKDLQRINALKALEKTQTKECNEKRIATMKGTGLRSENSNAKPINLAGIGSFLCIKDAYEFLSICDTTLKKRISKGIYVII